MNVYDKLLTELQNEKVQFYGNLLFPNHFRIILDGNENFFLALYVLKNHNFAFFNVSTTSLTHNLEFFFFYHFSGRNFLFSVVYNFVSNKNFVLNSLTNLFPQTKHIERLISDVSLIRFQNQQPVRN